VSLKRPESPTTSQPRRCNRARLQQLRYLRHNLPRILSSFARPITNKQNQVARQPTLHKLNIVKAIYHAACTTAIAWTRLDVRLWNWTERFDYVWSPAVSSTTELRVQHCRQRLMIASSTILDNSTIDLLSLPRHHVPNDPIPGRSLLHLCQKSMASNVVSPVSLALQAHPPLYHHHSWIGRCGIAYHTQRTMDQRGHSARDRCSHLVSVRYVLFVRPLLKLLFPQVVRSNPFPCYLKQVHI